ncbi:hypothetical protein FKM82_021607 [Ascaphus truei]
MEIVPMSLTSSNCFPGKPHTLMVLSPLGLGKTKAFYSRYPVHSPSHSPCAPNLHVFCYANLHLAALSPNRRNTKGIVVLNHRNTET